MISVLQKHQRYIRFHYFICTDELKKFKRLKRIVRAGTLGPPGSSSDECLKFVGSSKILSKTPIEFALYEDFTYLKTALLNGDIQVGVVPHAYQSINSFYMTPDIKLLGVFIFPTPVYGIARRKGSKKDLANCKKILTHPAPIPLMKYLVPEHLHTEIELCSVSSTSQAARMLHDGLDVLAITNKSAVEKYNLEFIKIYGEILMSWSVFGSNF